MPNQISEKDIQILKANNCYAQDWQNVYVKEGFDPTKVINSRFFGTVIIGRTNGKITIDDTECFCGIYDSTISDSEIGDNCLIQNIGGRISNYVIENNCTIINTGQLVCSTKTAFGHGTQIEALNEAGGREVPLSVNLTSQIAYLISIYRSRPEFINKLTEILNKEAEILKGKKGCIKQNAQIKNCGNLTDVYVGCYAKISGADKLFNGTIESCKEDPAIIGQGVIAEDFIILSGAHVESQSVLSKVFIGQGCRIGKQFSAENSLFFANCEGFHGEACAIFAGPYSVTHHKSTLLIASMYSFYNAGSGTNHSNHMYKLGPVHQGILERGCKTGSFSYLMLESHLAPFCVVIGKHMTNIDIPDFPFSYISESGGKSHLTPAMNVITVGTIRDQKKWASRDRRKANYKKDIINPSVYSPYTIEKMIRGRNKLSQLYKETPKDVESVNIGGIVLSRLLMRNSAKYYNMTILRYLYQKLFVKIEAQLNSGANWKNCTNSLKSNSQKKEEWTDISGLLCTKSKIDELISKIESGKIDSSENVLISLININNSYAEDEWNFVYNAIKNEFGFYPDELTKEKALELINDWQKTSRKMHNMTFADASKEFEDFAKIGFGIGQDDIEKDFEEVRGKKETNKVLVQMQKEFDAFCKGIENLKNMINDSK